MKIPKTISFEEVKKLIDKSKTRKHKCAIALGFYQCLRVSDVCNLKKDNVDLQTGFLHIKQSKGKKDRDIPIMKPSIHYLRYLPVDITRQGLHKMIKRLGKDILKKDIHFHTLRHSGATYYLNNGVDIRFIQQLLGHSRLSTTQIYTHINPTQLKNVFDNVWK